MSRYLFPVVVLLALVGGYVVGQGPDSKEAEPQRSDRPNPVLVEQQLRDGAGVINDLAPPVQASVPATAPVGRYFPADNGRMLDTTNGTLYAQSGRQWQVVATLPSEPPADALKPTP